MCVCKQIAYRFHIQQARFKPHACKVDVAYSWTQAIYFTWLMTRRKSFYSGIHNWNHDHNEMMWPHSASIQSAMPHRVIRTTLPTGHGCVFYNPGNCCQNICPSLPGHFRSEVLVSTICHVYADAGLGTSYIFFWGGSGRYFSAQVFPRGYIFLAGGSGGYCFAHSVFICRRTSFVHLWFHTVSRTAHDGRII